MEVALGTLLPLALLALAELASLEVNVRSEARAPKRDGSFLDGFFRPDPRLGYSPRPGSVVTARCRKDGRLVYDVTYATDGLGRRVTPVSEPERRTRHALFFGCSFVFGEGVDGDETLPARFGVEAPGYRPYNLGFSGYGPQAALARLEDPSFRSGVAEPEGLAVFLYLVGHERRVAGSMRVVTQWGASMPNYDVAADGRLVLEGSFRSSQPFRVKLFELLSKSESLRLAGVDVPLRIGEADYERTARILAAARDAYRRTSRGRFVVALYPSVDTRLRIVPHLRRLGVEVVDLSRLFDPEAPGLRLSDEGHPSPRAYQILARSLAEALGVRAPAAWSVKVSPAYRVSPSKKDALPGPVPSR